MGGISRIKEKILIQIDPDYPCHRYVIDISYIKDLKLIKNITWLILMTIFAKVLNPLYEAIKLRIEFYNVLVIFYPLEILLKF